MKKTLLYLIPFLVLSSCKDKTTLLKEKNQAQQGVETRLNYSPNVQFITTANFDENDEPQDITIILNQNGQLGNHKAIVDGEEDPIIFTDLQENPESFPVPELDELCSVVDQDTIYSAHKYFSEEDQQQGQLQADGIALYAFSVSGQCDGVETSCALIYVVPEGPTTSMSAQNMIPLFENQNYIMAGVMGLDGNAQNCQELFDKAIPISGCTDPSADNYSDIANISTPTCEYLGCTNPASTNYDPIANVEDGSCGTGCIGGFIYDNLAMTCLPDIPLPPPPMPQSGCTDPNAQNYMPSAVISDNTCICDAPYIVESGVASCTLDNVAPPVAGNPCEQQPPMPPASLACEDFCFFSAVSPEEIGLCSAIIPGFIPNIP